MTAKRWTGPAKAVVTAWKRRPVPSALATGTMIGVVVGALLGWYLQPVLTAPDGPEPGALVILSGHDDSVGGQRQALVDQWNAENKANPARIEVLPRTADGQWSEMVARHQSGESQADVYNLDVTWTADFVAEKRILPLREEGLDTDEFLKGPLSTCRADGAESGQLWALPFNTDAGLLFYRTDLVPKQQHAWTWQRMTAAVEQAMVSPTAAGPRPVAGYAGQFADYEGLTVNALEMIWAAGGDVVNEQGRVVIDSTEAAEGLKRLAAALAPGSPQVALPASRSFYEWQTTQAFADGQVAFMRNWPVAYRSLAETGQGEAGSPARVPFDVAQLPGKSVLGGQNLAIAASTKRPRAAQKLIEFLTSDRSQQILFERGGFAATRAIVYEDQAVINRYRYAPTLRDAIEVARSRPVTPHYARFSEAFRKVVLEALEHGGELPSDAVERLTGALEGRIS
ncbi:MAG TPA: extracellular solute-binding protein [Micromonosporaceae bacterium]|nr:extracellular solute-binding protein [Micromonosporaceae bacterium]